MKLLAYREKKGFSQKELACYLHEYSGKAITQAAVSMWENGRIPRKFWLDIIAGYTGNKVRANDFA